MSGFFRISYLCFFLLIPLVSVIAEDERLYYNIDDTMYHVKKNGSAYDTPSTLFSVGDSIEKVQYDRGQERLFYIDTSISASTTYSLNYIYLNRSNPSGHVVTVGSSIDVPIVFAIDGTRDIVYYYLDDIGGATEGILGKQVNATDAEKFLGIANQAGYTVVKSITVDETKAQRFFYSTDDTGLFPSRLYRYDAADGTPLKDITPSLSNDCNGATKVIYDPTEHKLYSFSQNSLFIHTLDPDTDQVDVTQKISYTLSDVVSFALRYASDGIEYILGINTSGPSVAEDDNGPANATRGVGDVSSVLSGIVGIEHISLKNMCDQNALDIDNDSIPDCKDPCPLDQNNLCSVMLYVSQGPIFAKTHLQSHVMDASGHGASHRQGKEGFTEQDIVESAYDPFRKILIYLDAPGTIRRVDMSKMHYDTVSTEKALFTPPADFGGFAMAVALDTDTTTCYVVSDYNGVTGYDFYSFDYTEENPSLTFMFTETYTPEIEHLIVDQRSGSGFEKHLYFSMYTQIFGYNLESPSGTFEVLSNQPTTPIGNLALNHNDNVLYYYIAQDSKAQVHQVSLDNIPSQATGTVFLSQTTNQSTYFAAVENVDLQYHAHIDGGKGRVYVSNRESTAIPIYYRDVEDPPCTTDCVTDAAFFDGTEGVALSDLHMIEGCNTSRSLDSDLDGSPDCADFWVSSCTTDTDSDGEPDCSDVCPNDPAKTSSAGKCGCGNLEIDADGDGLCLHQDGCDNDATKSAPGDCGCGIPDFDGDGDGMMSCLDLCDDDASKTELGICGCGIPDIDSDGDGFYNCLDQCADNPHRRLIEPCGCDATDDDIEDSDEDGVSDCNDICIDDPNFSIEEPACGCDVIQNVGDDDSDGTINCREQCVDGALEGCGCGIVDCSNKPEGEVFLTELSSLSNPPASQKHKKRSLNIFFKKYSGALLLREQNQGRTLERRRNKKKKDKKRNGKLSVKYEVIIKKVGKKSILKRILTNKTVLRVTKLKNGVYTVRYRAVIKRKKKTESTTNYSPSSSFRVPLP